LRPHASRLARWWLGVAVAAAFQQQGGTVGGMVIGLFMVFPAEYS
jgi:hypothetical protein